VLSCVFSVAAVTENFMLVCGAKVLGLQREAVLTIVLLYWLINITFAPTAMLSGRLSDRLGRKPLIVSALLVLGLLTAGFALVHSLVGVGALFLMHGVYQGLLRPSQKAFVADLAPAGRRSEVLGTYSMWTGLAAVPAPLAFGLAWDHLGWQVPFIASGALVLVSALLILLLIPSRRIIAD